MNAPNGVNRVVAARGKNGTANSSRAARPKGVISRYHGIHIGNPEGKGETSPW